MWKTRDFFWCDAATTAAGVELKSTAAAGSASCPVFFFAAASWTLQEGWSRERGESARERKKKGRSEKWAASALGRQWDLLWSARREGKMGGSLRLLLNTRKFLERTPERLLKTTEELRWDEQKRAVWRLFNAGLCWKFSIKTSLTSYSWMGMKLVDRWLLSEKVTKTFRIRVVWLYNLDNGLRDVRVWQ